MTYIVADRVADTSSTTGTGNFTLDNAASTGYRTLNAVCATTDTFPYAIINRTGGEWETGIGTYNGSHVFVRTTVIQSSNSNAAVNFSAGTKDFAIAPLGLGYKLLEHLGSAGKFSNVTGVASAASGALTIALKGADGNDPSVLNPVEISFSSGTATDGKPETLRITSALSLVVSSGSTLGVTSATACRLWWGIFNDSNTPRLGVVNCNLSENGIFALEDDVLYSSTAEGGAGAADSAGVIYTGTAVSSKAFRILGYFEWSTSGVATAGTWTTTNLNKNRGFGPGVPRPGSIVQLQPTSVLSNFSTSSASYQTAISKAFTFVSPANTARITLAGGAGAQASTAGGAAIFRDSTEIFNGYLYNGGGGSVYFPLAFQVLDRPNSTSSITYAGKIKSDGTNLTLFPYGPDSNGSLARGSLMIEELMS